MKSNSKLDAVVGLDSEGSNFTSLNGKVIIGERANVVHKILNGFQRLGNRSIPNMSKDAEHRVESDRFSWGSKDSSGDSVNLLIDADEKREHGSGRKSGPLLSGTAYCISSCSMILLNKVVLSSYAFNAGISLMFYQNLISTVIVVVLGFCGLVSLEKLRWKLIKVWIPVNVIFIGMLVSGMYSLKCINIAMVTILKNVTNILTAIGEFYIFRKRQNQKVWTAMFLMCIVLQIISAITGGITDITFDAGGYAWQIINCILTACYSLTLRRVMDKAKQLTRTGSLNEVSMVLLNNMLSLPFAIFLILLFNEWEDVIRMPMFWVVATASGLLGLAISFTSIWFLNQTGPTTYSLVGSLNKIPISIAGLVLFNVPLSLPNFFSILFGLFAGVFFARAKMS
ncbi:GDP-mannose transporter GONST2-like isoform X3 [Actinidia eriantha]|uniref:GDP-mannose transporter GONST2-like isoform X3 n=1 Tax=Actinidia eriantha TaxID=165200 RepID=UPI002588F19C|nr:GDP-mannose transporter GONST2-like isoform X3 [Actinidia eriantha]